MSPHTAPSCPFDVVSTPLGLLFLFILGDLARYFLQFFNFPLRTLQRPALPTWHPILLPALHFSVSLSTCQDCLFKEHPTLRTSIFSSDTFFLFFLFFSLANALHLLEFTFPELIIFSSSASFLFLRKEMLYLKKYYDFHRRFSFLSSSVILPLLKIELKGILSDDAFCNKPSASGAR